MAEVITPADPDLAAQVGRAIDGPSCPPSRMQATLSDKRARSRPWSPPPTTGSASADKKSASGRTHVHEPLKRAQSRVPSDEPLHLIVDSTGLSIVGEGEWAAVKHGGRGTRGWKKLHFGVDGSGAIVAHVLTAGSADDAMTGLTLIDAVEGNISRVTADTAYDTIAIYEAAGARGATVVVPPTRTATVSRRRPRSSARDHTILRVKKVGRRQWKKEAGYHRQARVENAFFRYKSIIGGRLRARHPMAQETEAALACSILNRMTELGRPASFPIGP